MKLSTCIYFTNLADMSMTKFNLFKCNMIAKKLKILDGEHILC